VISFHSRSSSPLSPTTIRWNCHPHRSGRFPKHSPNFFTLFCRTTSLTLAAHNYPPLPRTVRRKWTPRILCFFSRRFFFLLDSVFPQLRNQYATRYFLTTTIFFFLLSQFLAYYCINAVDVHAEFMTLNRVSRFRLLFFSSSLVL
jgi:hypothetical protein